MNYYARVGITALIAFIITIGTAVSAIGHAPSTWEIVVGLVGGLVAAAHSVERFLTPPPS